MADIMTLPEGDRPIELSLSRDELDAHRDQIIAFIESVVESAGADGAVIGLSGGIDSSLTATLGAKALGPDQIHGLVLPSAVNPDESMSDAERLASGLGIEYDVIEIGPIVSAFFDAYPAGKDEQTPAGNVRVRTRAVLNYFVANTENKIVLGTGNRSEALTGYFTKYGDQAVDCNPIGNLYKQQVRQLAAHIGVEEALIEKPPSAEMWHGQTDAQEMGVSYDLLDAVLALHIDGPLTRRATVETLGIEAAAVDRVRELYQASAHKRELPAAPAPIDL
ncbi:NAD+ synthase [Halocatena halophila]|uniref:NAD+ synthase n=1 Tax=Halocatena halophila TaxID=2814576 RepID=UPI002ED38B34